MIKEAIVKIVNKEDLSYDEAYTVMNEIIVVKPRLLRMPHSWQHCLPKVQERKRQTR